MPFVISTSTYLMYHINVLTDWQISAPFMDFTCCLFHSVSLLLHAVINLATPADCTLHHQASWVCELLL